ncbi:MAG: hypothetical protein KGI50_07655, partial [Patescibacteria group bacterium]|nr:hypothetical protein [Patescibacteria group bacterium]
EKAHEKLARKFGKAIHFGIIYGLVALAIYEKLKRTGSKIKRSLVEEAYATYFKKYAGVAAWRQESIDYAERTGKFIPTLYGLQRPVGEGNRDSFWGNQAINSPIQGTAGQYLFLCLDLINRYKKSKYELLYKGMCNEVHDNLLYSTKLRNLSEADAQLQTVMEEHAVEESRKRFGIDFLVPMVSEPAAGFRMGTMVEGYDRKKPLEDFVSGWVVQNREIEEKFKKDPLAYVDLSRGK